MPTRTYMVVDARRDHSFRVPRPDFSVAYGTPNACNQCHKDKPNSWAAETVAKWYGPIRRQEPQFVAAIDAGRRGLPNAEKSLTILITDSAQPAIARATALDLLPGYLHSFFVSRRASPHSATTMRWCAARPCALWSRYHRRTGFGWAVPC